VRYGSRTPREVEVGELDPLNVFGRGALEKPVVGTWRGHAAKRDLILCQDELS